MLREEGRETVAWRPKDLISKGSLRSDAIAKVLVPSLLNKADRIRRGCTKRTSSEVGNSEAGLMELGWLLGGALQNPSLQKAFGVPRSQCRDLCPLINSFLPRFFVAEGDVLVDSCQKALALLPCNRAYMLVRDEVVYARTFNLIYGLSETDPSKAYVVGGQHPHKSLLAPAEWHAKLKKDDLASVHACTMLKSVDARSGGFLIQQVPRARLVDAEAELAEIASILDCCCKANGDTPPICVAFDGHGSFASIHDLLLGLLPPSVYDGLPMLKHLSVGNEQLDMALCPFKYMTYKQNEQQPLFGCVDPKHILKAISRATRSAGRVLKMFLEHTLAYVFVFFQT